MRCSNCGWENQDAQERCSKCNTRLVIQVKPALKTNVSGLPEGEENTNKEKVELTISIELVTCSYSDCNYPFSKSNKICPRCKRMRKDTNAITFEVKPIGETINPFQFNHSQRKTFCFFTSNQDYGSETYTLEFDDTGQEIILNNQNLKVENNGNLIVEATLFFEKGKWFLSNPKEIYIMKKGKVELHNGDVLKIGDKTFSFSAENLKQE